MPTNNSINCSSTGLIKYDGAGTFSSTTTTTHDILIGAANNGINNIALTNGQLAIGSTSADPVAATITSGSGVIITNGPGSISIAAVGAGLTWTVITTATAAAVNNGYGINASSVAVTLPATSAVGSVIAITGLTGSWNIVQGSGQLIHLGSSVTTTGAGGSLASTNANDSIIIVCLVANTTWVTFGSMGNITVV